MPYGTSWFTEGQSDTNISILLTSLLVVTSGLLFSVLSERGYRNFPAVGPTYPLLSYIGAFRFLWDAKGMLQEGYDRYINGLFRVAEMNHWLIIATGEYAEEMRRAPDNDLSPHEAIKEQLQVPYTLGKEIYDNHYHISTIRSELTRNVESLFPDVNDELVEALKDEIVLEGKEWTKLKPLPSLMRVISRTSNRAFLGLPKCRDPEYRDLNVQLTIDVIVCSTIINLFPSVLRPIIGNLISKFPRSLAIAMKHVNPIVEERKRLASMGEVLPNDMLSWLMADQSRVKQDFTSEESARDLAIRLLTVNFSAIHTTSITLMHALYDLAAEPRYLEPLREEVESVIIQEGGWSKGAIDKMVKIDSFIKESLRMNGITTTSNTRKAVKDFFFRDGARIPAGSYIAALSTPIHFDDTVYTDAATFDGFRFAKMRENPKEQVKHQIVSTSQEFLAFGHGRGACPGRFFAANELKCALAHVVVLYDLKLVREGVRPRNKWYGAACLPDSNAEVLFRCRQL